MQTTQLPELVDEIRCHVRAHRAQYADAIESVLATLDGPETKVNEPDANCDNEPGTKVDRLGRAVSQELEIADAGPPGLLPTKEHARRLLVLYCLMVDPDVRSIDARLDLGVAENDRLSHELMRSMVAISMPPADRFIDGTSRAELDREAQGLWDKLVEKAWTVERPRAGTAGGGKPGAMVESKDYQPAKWFTLNTKIPPPRLRQAARPNRKSMRVRTDTIDGAVCYSVEDAKRCWPSDIRQP